MVGSYSVIITAHNNNILNNLEVTPNQKNEHSDYRNSSNMNIKEEEGKREEGITGRDTRKRKPYSKSNRT